MCGIAGVINLNGAAAVEEEVLHDMAHALLHRGPDEGGLLRQDGVALASRRLSIVGLADGQQPVGNEDGSVWVVYNGELFDYPEVKAGLEARGHRFRTHCDTELLPHLWEEYGEGMLERLRGQFAFALYDRRQRRLLVARDRFGICPLYWVRRGDWLLFASEIRALLASGMVPARPDVRGISHAFTFFALPGPVTCFEGVECLLPGHSLHVQLGAAGESARVAERAYWAMDFPDRGQEEPGGDPKKVVDDFEAVFHRAVAKRLRADVPVVSYLSGGVDSSVVVAMATRQRALDRSAPVPTFTIRILDPGLDEAPEAALVARHIGAEAVVVECGREDVLHTYPELIRAAEAPVIDTACAALLLLAREVHARGYKVALTGEGADEWLAGYPWYKVHRLLGLLDAVPGLRLSRLARGAYLRLTGAPRFPRGNARRIEAAIGGPNAWMDIYGLFSTAKWRFFSGDMWKRLDGHLPYEDLRLDLDRARRWHPLNRSLYLGARVMLPGLLLSSKGDRVAMHSSVETRYPFLDEDVFAFLARLHPRWKLRRLRDKYILRRLAERWVPKEVAWRRKAMFRAPLDGFHGAEAGVGFIDQLLSEESLRRTGYFDAAAVGHWRQAFRRMRAGSAQRTVVEMGLVGVVATQLWHHLFIDPSLADLGAAKNQEPRTKNEEPRTRGPRSQGLTGKAGAAAGVPH
jgi:asparagine synthase (glutamine-hydrolysing)